MRHHLRLVVRRPHVVVVAGGSGDGDDDDHSVADNDVDSELEADTAAVRLDSADRCWQRLRFVVDVADLLEPLSYQMNQLAKQMNLVNDCLIVAAAVVVDVVVDDVDGGGGCDY